MEQPSLTTAPYRWLQAVVRDTREDSDEETVSITIKNAKDGNDYTFAYILGDVRSEFERRQSN